MLVLPFAILTDLWLGAISPAVGVAVYLLPSAAWLMLSAAIAALETKYSYAEPLTPASFLGRFGRMFLLAFLSTGMLGHQSSAFAEGLFGPLHSEFERTPKAASVTRRARTLETSAAGRASTVRKINPVKVHWPYVLCELFFIAYHLAWAALFAVSGLFWSALAAAGVAGCSIYLVFFYGDHAGKVCFVLDQNKLLSFAQGVWRHVCERSLYYAFMLGALAYLLVLLSVAGQFFKFVLGTAFLPRLVSLFYVDMEHNIPTYFSVLLILCAAMLLAVIAIQNGRQGIPHVSKWVILSTGFLFMAFDEAFQVHERLNIPVGTLLGDGSLGVFYFAWVIPGIALVSVLGLFFLRFLLHLPATTRFRFLMAAIFYIGGAIGIELIGSRHAELHGYENWTYSMIATLEESLEMAGLIVFIWALLNYCADNHKEVRSQIVAYKPLPAYAMTHTPTMSKLAVRKPGE
jgi:hypothetical protein